jgi:hypothetical protein
VELSAKDEPVGGPVGASIPMYCITLSLVSTLEMEKEWERSRDGVSDVCMLGGQKADEIESSESVSGVNGSASAIHGVETAEEIKSGCEKSSMVGGRKSGCGKNSIQDSRSFIKNVSEGLGPYGLVDRATAGAEEVS